MCLLEKSGFTKTHLPLISTDDTDQNQVFVLKGADKFDWLSVFIIGENCFVRQG
jgi:hypothetical protein